MKKILFFILVSIVTTSAKAIDIDFSEAIKEKERLTKEVLDSMDILVDENGIKEPQIGDYENGEKYSHDLREYDKAMAKAYLDAYEAISERHNWFGSDFEITPISMKYLLKLLEEREFVKLEIFLVPPVKYSKKEVFLECYRSIKINVMKEIYRKYLPIYTDREFNNFKQTASQGMQSASQTARDWNKRKKIVSESLQKALGL